MGYRKDMRQANKALEDAERYRDFIRNGGSPKPAVKKPSSARKENVCGYNACDHKFYTNLSVVKISKGDVRVEADGKVLDRRFKSTTQANEWCATHKK